MRRRLKPKNSETFFHITVRTAQKKYWLVEEPIKIAWETKLRQLAQAYYVNVCSYAILSNHVHLVLRVNLPQKDLVDLKERFEYLESTLVSRRKWHDEMEDKFYDRFTDLSSFMRDLNQWVAAWHNKNAFEETQTTGHLWGRRFFSKVVGNGQHLLTTMSYVDLNPVRAGLVQYAGDFEYSTAGKLKKQLDDGIKPFFPPVGWLKHVKQEERAEAYLSWLDFLADCDRKNLAPKVFKAYFWAINQEKVDIQEVFHQIKNKEPSDWTTPIFASREMTKDILVSEGWTSFTQKSRLKMEDIDSHHRIKPKAPIPA